MKDYEGMDLSSIQIETIERAMAFLVKANYQVMLLNEQLMHQQMLPFDECRAGFELSRAYLDLQLMLHENVLTAERREREYMKSILEKFPKNAA
jgi:hypothetical protein